MKTLEKIAMLTFAAVISSAQVNCPTMIKPTEAQIIQTIEKRDRTIRKDLEDIMQSTHCLVHEVKYKLEGAPEGTPLFDDWGNGTAFAYAKKDGYTYLVTSNHLVIDEPKVKVEAVPIPGSMVPQILVYKKTEEKLKLAKNIKEKDSLDTIKVEIVARDKENDIAILRTKEKLYVSNHYILDPNFQPQLEDELFLLGFPEGFGPYLTKGSIANLNDKRQGKTYNAMDVTSSFGHSGSPYFIRRGDKLYWTGLYKAIWLRKGAKVPLLEFGVPIKDFVGLLNKYK